MEIKCSWCQKIIARRTTRNGLRTHCNKGCAMKQINEIDSKMSELRRSKSDYYKSHRAKLKEALNT